MIKKCLVNQKERVCEGIPVLILTLSLEKRKNIKCHWKLGKDKQEFAVLVVGRVFIIGEALKYSFSFYPSFNCNCWEESISGKQILEAKSVNGVSKWYHTKRSKECSVINWWNWINQCTKAPRDIHTIHR